MRDSGVGGHSSSSPRAQSSNGDHSPVLNLSKSGNDEEHSGGAPSDVHSPSPNLSVRDDDDDNISDGNVSEVDEHNDKDDDGMQTLFYLILTNSS